MIRKKLETIKPKRALDVGCGCGSFTATISPFCEKLEAIDSSKNLIERCQHEHARPNTTYRVMDGANLQYPDRSFNVVLERASLHHIAHWQKALDEMVRVSNGYVLIEEPMTDLRSIAKKNADHAQKLFLELQHEVQWPHFPYIPVTDMVGFLKSKGLKVEYEILRSDELIPFEEFFSGFEHFAQKSNRRDYWMNRLTAFQSELGNGPLSENDRVFISGVI